jgi:AAA family ATP:ADP antiporter
VHPARDTGPLLNRDPSRRDGPHLIDVRPGEGAALLLSTSYFFCLLSAYYILRPLRDSMGVAGGVRNIKWLYAATLGAMLLASVVFAAIASRYPRGRFIPWAYRFFALNVVAFFVVLRLTPQESRVWVGRVFFVWTSVFNLFVVSVFWSFMADIFGSAQGRRLFGFIAAGGTLGQVCASFAVRRLAEPVGAVNLLLVSALLLELACQCVRALNRQAVPGGPVPEGPGRGGPGSGGAREPPGGRAWDGLKGVVRSPYLAGIALFVFCYTITSTLLNVTKLHVGAQQAAGEDARVAFFATIDFWTGLATVLAQLLLTGRLMVRFGVAATLGVLPAVTILGFLALGGSLVRPEHIPIVAVITAFEALRRAANFAVSRPAREVLYTVVDRRDKYASKNFIDTFVYRLGDQVGVWAYDGLVVLAAGAAAVSLLAVAVSAGWLVLSLALGRRQAALARCGPCASACGLEPLVRPR